MSAAHLLDNAPIRSLPFEVWHGPLDLDAALAGRHRKAGARTSAASLGPTEIPAATVYVVKRDGQGEEKSGIVVWSVQRGLNAWGVSPTLFPDGVCGGKTKRGIEQFQEATGLLKDGVFGPKSSEVLSLELERQVGVVLPDLLLGGQVLGESGRLFGAVNWSVPGGVDCHLTQRRLYSADFGDEKAEHRVFTPAYQLGLSARSLRDWHDRFFGQPGARTHEMAWRLSALEHNYPGLAQKLAALGKGGLSAYYFNPQSWVEAIGVHFADSDDVRTPYEWGEFYALGAPEHNTLGLVTRFVSSWGVA